MRKFEQLPEYGKQCVIYARQSPSPKSRDGLRDGKASLSLETQLDTCRKHAAYKGYEVIGEHSDPALSGKDTIERRPGLQEVLKLTTKNEVIVVVYNLSRLSRRQSITWKLLDDRGDYQLKIESATEPFDTSTPMGRAMLGMLAVWAQLQADMVSESTRSALQHLKAEGVHLGPPSLARLHPEVVQSIQDLYATGDYTMVSLAAHLNEHIEDFPTARGKLWHSTQVARTLKLSV